MAYVISFSIYKCGTGKTTSAVNTAAALAQLENRVLLVDLDQQASSTRYIEVNPDEVNPILYHVFVKQRPASIARQKTKFGFDLLPSSAFMGRIHTYCHLPLQTKSADRLQEHLLEEGFETCECTLGHFMLKMSSVFTLWKGLLAI